MKQPPMLALLCLLSICGCGSQSVLLDTDGAYLFLAPDGLALPGERVDLRARLQGGDLLQARAGYVVRFLREGKLYKAAETGPDGTAVVSFTPPKPGVYAFTANLSPNGFPDQPPPGRDFALVCRAAETPAMIVDLDKTVVASGFQQVLIGEPKPMPGSPAVMKLLARKYAPIYLTHRPDYFGPKSKAWLGKHDYPQGPLLLSDIGGFLGGSGAFKTQAIRRLRSRFTGIQLGIGDKVSDARSYHENGMRAVLILQEPSAMSQERLVELIEALGTMPEQVQVVTSWSQIQQAILHGASYPPDRMRERLTKRLEATQAAEGPGQ